MNKVDKFKGFIRVAIAVLRSVQVDTSLIYGPIFYDYLNYGDAQGPNGKLNIISITTNPNVITDLASFYDYTDVNGHIHLDLEYFWQNLNHYKGTDFDEFRDILKDIVFTVMPTGVSIEDMVDDLYDFCTPWFYHKPHDLFFGTPVFIDFLKKWTK